MADTRSADPDSDVSDQPDVARPVVLFDGACPLCAREIAHYRRLPGAAGLAWIDISREPDLERRFGVRPETAMARFHVRGAQGHWLTGAAAFAELWSHIAGYRLLATGVRRLHLLPILDLAYSGFARWRLRRRHCQGGVCHAAPGAPSND